MAEGNLSLAGRVLASKGASKGGNARAKKLSPEERTTIARAGGKARQQATAKKRKGK